MCVSLQLPARRRPLKVTSAARYGLCDMDNRAIALTKHSYRWIVSRIFAARLSIVNGLAMIFMPLLRKELPAALSA